jgi:hypothetical protein
MTCCVSPAFNVVSMAPIGVTGTAIAFPRLVEPQLQESDMEVDLETFYRHHDLLVELGKVEMAMERLDEVAANERDVLRPVLTSRLTHLREELVHLAA